MPENSCPLAVVPSKVPFGAIVEVTRTPDRQALPDILEPARRVRTSAPESFLAPLAVRSPRVICGSLPADAQAARARQRRAEATRRIMDVSLCRGTRKEIRVATICS